MTTTTTTTNVMVELRSGYGDGYGIVAVADGEVAVNKAEKVTHYVDGTRMAAWTAAILSRPSVALIDARVRVHPGAVKRVIGPLDCPEAVRVRAARFTRNWGDRAFIAKASDAELAAALAGEDHAAVSGSLGALRAKYAG